MVTDTAPLFSEGIQAGQERRVIGLLLRSLLDPIDRVLDPGAPFGPEAGLFSSPYEKRYASALLKLRALR